MTVTRFDARKQLILDESNAIGTTYLRAYMLGEPYTTRITQLLRDYVDARIEFYNAGIDQERTQKALDRSSELQTKLWQQAIDVSSLDTRAVTTGLFIQSLNDVIDFDSKRQAAMSNRVPDVIIFLNIFIAFVVVGMIGYGTGLGEKRHRASTLILIFLIAMVLLVIIDVDRPRRGLITTGQASMLTLQQNLKEQSFRQPYP